MAFELSLKNSLLYRGIYFTTLFLSNVILSRLLTAQHTGQLFFLTNLFSFVIVIGSLSLESAFTFFIKSEQVKPEACLSVGLLWSLLISLISGLGYWTYFSKAGYEQPLLFTALSVCYTAGILWSNYAVSIFYAHDEIIGPNLIMSVNNVLLIVALLVAAWISLSVNFLFILFFVSVVLQGALLVIWFYTRKKNTIAFILPQKAVSMSMFRYGIACVAANVLFFLVYRIDYWFVNAYCSKSDLGNYLQASKMGQLLLIIPQIMASVVFPHSANKPTEDKSMVTAILRLIKILMMAFCVLMCVVLAVGHLVFPTMFGDSFEDMHVPFLLLLPGIFALSCLALLSAYFAGKNKVFINFRGALLALLVMLLCSWMFSSSYSIKKAAAISTLAYFSNFLFSLVLFIKHEKIKLNQLLTMNKEDWTWIKNIVQTKAVEKR